MEYHSGCNFWINHGENKHQPIGTATSMHECGDCEKLEACKVKKETVVWEYNDEVKAQMDEYWKEMKT